VVTKPKTTTSLLSDSKLITGNHLDLDTESHGIVDGLLGVGTGRVEDGQKTDKLETGTWGVGSRTVDLLVSDSESTETTTGKLLNIVLKLVLELVGLVAGTEFDNDTSHTLGGTLEPASVTLVGVSDFGTLVDRVERLEVEELDTLTGELGVGKGTNDTTVDSVLVLGTGTVGSEETDTLDVELGVALDVLLVDSKLVGGKGTGLVGTKNGDTSELFDGSDTGDDSLVLGELLSTNGESDGQDSRHSNGDTTNQEDKNVVETTSVRVSEVGVENENLEQNENTDGDKTESTDTGENHLQVTGLVVVLTDEGSGTTEESVGTGGDDDTLTLSLFTGGTGETLVTELLAGGKGFTGKSGLVHRDIDSFGETTIGGTDITVLEGDEISWDKLGGLDLLPGTISLDLGLGGKGSHKSLDSVTSVSLLDETNGRVDEQKQDNTDEVLPIWWLTTTVGKSNGDQSGTLHDPRERVPHERKELEDDVLLLLFELVGTEDTDTVGSLGVGETVLVTLEELEDLLHNNVLDVDLVLVVQIGSGELDLKVSFERLAAGPGAVIKVSARMMMRTMLTVFMSTLACWSPSCFSSISLYSLFFLSGSTASGVSAAAIVRIGVEQINNISLTSWGGTDGLPGISVMLNL